MPAEPAQPLLRPLAFYRHTPARDATARAADVDGRPPGSPLRTASRVRRKTFERRRADRTRLARRSTQAAFLLLNLWIGARFYLFVRYCETRGHSAWVPRPPGVEGWLPIAALMNLKYWVLTATLPTVHPAGLFLLLAFIAISLAFRKAFCSWLCPIGTLSESLWQGGRELLDHNVTLPTWLDIPLRALKYVLLGLFVYAVWHMGVAEIRAFLDGPYGLIADVKMLDFFRKLGSTGALVLAILVLSSVFVKNAWCRYLCPYGALMGLVSLVSPTRIRRDADACIDCGKCAKACPSLLPVDRRITIKSPECTGCLECITACPVREALALSAPRRRAVPGWVVAVGIAVLFFAIVGYARLSGHWHTNLPAERYFELVPNASTYTHPGY